MKKSLKSFFKGFSLVELMISLITISLITAAFAPIITKKLSSMGVTVGSFGGNNSGSGEINCPSNITCEAGYYLDGTCKCQPCSDENCTYCAHNVCSICNDGFSLLNGKCENLACHESGGLPTEACCKSVNAVFIDKKYTGTTDLCMMKYNAGDEENTYKVGTIDKIYHPKYPKIGVQITQTGTSTCTSSANCCWKGNTSNATNSYPGYSAGNRTVCRQNAATKICNNWAFPGTKQGSWRLLTKAEGTKLAAAIAAESDSDHFLTKYMGSNGLQLCDRTSASKGSNQCPSGDACKGARDSRCYPSHVWVSEKNLAMRIEGGVASVNVNSYDNYAMGVRCVTSKVDEVVSSVDNEISNHNDVEPRNQDDCPEGTLYINKRFLGSGSNLCVTQYNVTDDRYAMDGKPYHPLYVKFGVKVVDVNESCNTEYCCWKGATSSGVTNYSNYSSDNRSVCRQKAADEICNNWAYAGSKVGHWRLMTKSEATALATYINYDGYYPGSEPFSFLTKYLDSDGLQLCDRTSASYGSNQCPSGDACKGARDSRCYPSHVWVSEKNLAMRIENGIASVNVNSYDNYAMGVRCVSDNIRKTIPDPAEETYQTNEPRNQGDCDKYKALFIDKKYLNGASRNICMIKYNFADYDAADKGKPRYGTNTASDYSDSNAKVTVVDVSTSCSGDYCCWKGTTSNGSGTYDYDATNRTVCRQKAATNLCANWAPDNATDKRWRLLSSNEAKGLVNYITSETKYSSFLSKFIPNKYTSVEDGLQLCDRTSVSQGSNYCPIGSVCKGARDSRCYVSDIWLSEDNKTMHIENGIASVNVNSYDNYAMSVRCVTDNINWAD